MAFPPRFRSVSGGSGTLTAAPIAGTTTAGTALATSGVEEGTLSCRFDLLAETSTLTLTAKFQVSDDNSTWYDVAGDAQNPANVAQAAGTGGADTVVSRVIPVPAGVLGYNYVRAAIVNGVATGAVGDTYAFTWKYRFVSGF